MGLGFEKNRLAASDFFLNFGASKIESMSAMVRIASFFVLTLPLLGLCSCQNEHSKEYQAMKKEVSDLQLKVQETEDCDELQLLSFSILGLCSDLDNLQQETTVTEAEIGELGDLVDGLDAAWRGKVASLECNQYQAAEEEYDTSGEEDFPEIDNE